LHADSSMLPASAHAPAGAGQAVLAEAERIVRDEQARELAKARRKELKEEKQRLAREERERKAAEQRERHEQERRAADSQRRAMLERVRERGAACGGNILHAVFALVPDPRDPRGVRHSLASVLALVTMALACKNETMAEIISWIAQAGPEVLAAAGARLLPDGTRIPPSGKTVVRVLQLHRWSSTCRGVNFPPRSRNRPGNRRNPRPGISGNHLQRPSSTIADQRRSPPVTPVRSRKSQALRIKAHSATRRRKITPSKNRHPPYSAKLESGLNRYEAASVQRPT
jgi:hypothetical protein